MRKHSQNRIRVLAFTVSAVMILLPVGVSASGSDQGTAVEETGEQTGKSDAGKHTGSDTHTGSETSVELPSDTRGMSHQKGQEALEDADQTSVPSGTDDSEAGESSRQKTEEGAGDDESSEDKRSSSEQKPDSEQEFSDKESSGMEPEKTSADKNSSDGGTEQPDENFTGEDPSVEETQRPEKTSADQEGKESEENLSGVNFSGQETETGQKPSADTEPADHEDSDAEKSREQSEDRKSDGGTDPEQENAGLPENIKEKEDVSGEVTEKSEWPEVTDVPGEGSRTSKMEQEPDEKGREQTAPDDADKKQTAAGTMTKEAEQAAGADPETDGTDRKTAVKSTDQSETAAKAQKRGESAEKEVSANTVQRTEQKETVIVVPAPQEENTAEQQKENTAEQRKIPQPVPEDSQALFAEKRTETDSSGERAAAGTAAASADQKQPEIRIHGAKDRSANSSPLQITVEFQDDNLKKDSAYAWITATNSGRRIEGIRGKETEDGITFSFPEIGEDDYYVLTAGCADEAGNQTVRKISFTENQKGAVAALKNAALKDSTVNQKSVTPEFHVAGVDEIMEASADVNGKSVPVHFNKEGNLVLSSPLTEEGEYTVQIRTKDASGNEVKSDPVRFAIDRTRPKISMKQAENTASGKAGGNFVDIIISKDQRADRFTEILVDGRKVEQDEYTTLKNGNIRLRVSGKGRHTVKVTAEDAAGNQETSAMTVSAGVSETKRVGLGTAAILLLAGSAAGFLAVRKRNVLRTFIAGVFGRS